MIVQPTVIVNVDTTGLARLIGKRKWAKAFKEMCEVAEQQASKDYLEKLRSELPGAFQELIARRERDYTKPDGSPEGLVAADFIERLSIYKQARFDFYLKSMLQLVEADINASAKRP